MLLRSRLIVAGLFCSLIGFAERGASAQETAKAGFSPKGFLDQYCLKCHDSKVQKGDRRLDNLPLALGEDALVAERWQEVMHQIQLGEMPPPKKPQPSAVERQALIAAWLRTDLGALYRLSLDDNSPLQQRLMARVLHARNQRMAERLLPQLPKGGVFVAVGALHLPGADGLLARLKAAGFSLRALD